MAALTVVLATFDRRVLTGGDLDDDESYPDGLLTPSCTLYWYQLNIWSTTASTPATMAARRSSGAAATTNDDISDDTTYSYAFLSTSRTHPRVQLGELELATHMTAATAAQQSKARRL